MARCLGLLVILLAFAFLASPAATQEQKKSKLDVEAIFKKLDGNSDGKLQKDEFLRLADRFTDKEKARTKLTATFAMIDAEKRGYLSKDQFRSYFEKRKDDGRQ